MFAFLLGGAIGFCLGIALVVYLLRSRGLIE